MTLTMPRNTGKVDSKLVGREAWGERRESKEEEKLPNIRLVLNLISAYFMRSPH